VSNATIVCAIKIGQYAFIAAGTVVMKDVPDYALIGAGSVVTSDVPANTIVVGIPGRLLRYIESK